MNVKCPKCRFKFDAPTADINDSNEVSIICPRCGHAFITAPQPLTEPAENKQDEPLLIKPERTEAELYFSAVKCIEENQYDEARALVSVLLRLSPNEAMYMSLKDKLTDASKAEAKQSAKNLKQQEPLKQEIKSRTSNNPQLEEERYKKAIEFMNNGHYNAAQTYVTKLLEMSPNNPRYIELDRQLVRKRTFCLSSSNNSGSGCMVTVLALILSLISIALVV